MFRFIKKALFYGTRNFIKCKSVECSSTECNSAELPFNDQWKM